MAEETNIETAPETAPDGAPETDDGTRARDRREARRAKDAIEREKEANRRLSELEAKAEEREAQLEHAERKAGELDKVLARKESLIEKLQRERDEATAERDKVQRSSRTTDLIDRLAEETKVPKVRIKGLLLAAHADDPEFDISPERIDEFTVKSVKKKLTGLDPTAFQITPTENGAARPRPSPAPAAHLHGLPNGERPAADDIARLMADPVFQPPKDGRPI